MKISKELKMFLEFLLFLSVWIGTVFVLLAVALTLLSRGGIL